MESVFDVRCQHGESPVWDAGGGCLYWVDLLKGFLHKGNIQTGEVKSYDAGCSVGVLAVRQSGGLIMATGKGIGFWSETESKLQILHPLQNADRTRFNDGAVDAQGRFFAGTMAHRGDSPLGVLYRVDKNLCLRKMEESLLIPNGMGWSEDNQTFYLTDTNKHVIYSYDYDMATGDISNRIPFIEFGKDEFPDGMCMDRQGSFWVAMWGGGKINKFGKNGQKQEEFILPVKYPTSCCFGGSEMKTLFIATSSLPLSEEEKESNPWAGKVLKLDTPRVGKKQFLFLY
ncbi:MAG: hypothetical protein CRN43_01565 [Candidatus Nephrothrix sp. EaCA]|nr:MAG: hypothetical protein CRN43_01565 [Candidatus Nephrothrix sp. EaCA]